MKRKKIILCRVHAHGRKLVALCRVHAHGKGGITAVCLHTAKTRRDGPVCPFARLPEWTRGQNLCRVLSLPCVYFVLCRVSVFAVRYFGC